jgi:DNA-binding PadR family transcriptional regulator
MSMSSRNPFQMPVSPLQILLLIQLENSPKYGYEMLKNLKDEFDGVWEPKTGTVYPALKSLEKKGFVKTQDTKEKDYYVITKKGRGIFKQLLGFMENSTKFSTKYMIVVFKLLSEEMRIGFLDFISDIMGNKNLFTYEIMTKLSENLDIDSKRLFLKKMRFIIKQRLKIIDELIEKSNGEKI